MVTIAEIDARLATLSGALPNIAEESPIARDLTLDAIDRWLEKRLEVTRQMEPA